MQPGCNPVATVLKCCNRVAAGRCGRGAKVWRPGGNRGEIDEIFSYGDCDQSPRTRGETL
jgi:hypothetical protein